MTLFEGYERPHINNHSIAHYENALARLVQYLYFPGDVVRILVDPAWKGWNHHTRRTARVVKVEGMNVTLQIGSGDHREEIVWHPMLQGVVLRIERRQEEGRPILTDRQPLGIYKP